jgi:hypothetical protein
MYASGNNNNRTAYPVNYYRQGKEITGWWTGYKLMPPKTCKLRSAMSRELWRNFKNAFRNWELCNMYYAVQSRLPWVIFTTNSFSKHAF